MIHNPTTDLHPAWYEYVTRRALLPQVRSVIASSWERCWATIDPYSSIKPHHLAENHLHSMQANHFQLIAIVKPVIEDIYQYIENSGSAVVFANNVGYLLEMIGDVNIMSELDRMGVRPGTLCAESELGTNAISLALLERTPEYVAGIEHFRQPLHKFGSAAAPIFAMSGKLLGTLGIITQASHFHPHTLGLVMSAARSIEAQRQADQLLEEQNNQLTQLNAILARIKEGILVWNNAGTIIHANPMVGDILKVSPGTLMGSKLQAYVSLPPNILEALDKQTTVSDYDIQLTVAGEPISCLLSLHYIHSGQNLRATIAVIRPEKSLREFVQRKVGSPTFDLQNLVGESSEIRRIRRLARSAAAARGCVLVRGQPGTGKNLLARAIHYHSLRSDAPFVVFSCTAVPSELVLPELLGVERRISNGSPHTSKVELADGGSLFFQDIEALPLEAQYVLLNFLELGVIQRIGSRKAIEADVRVIASSAAPLEDLVTEGNFRSDLLYRLSSFEITLPALQERKTDMDIIIDQILQRLSRQLGYTISLTKETVEFLKSYSWPGNIRELESVLTRASIQASPSQWITPANLPQLQLVLESENPTWNKPIGLMPLEDMKLKAIFQTAHFCKGNISKMSKILHISRSTIWRCFKEMNISPDQFRNHANKFNDVTK